MNDTKKLLTFFVLFYSPLSSNFVLFLGSSSKRQIQKENSEIERPDEKHNNPCPGQSWSLHLFDNSNKKKLRQLELKVNSEVS